MSFFFHFFFNSEIILILILIHFYAFAFLLIDASNAKEFIDWKEYDAKHMKSTVREYYRYAMDARIRVPQRHKYSKDPKYFDLYVRKFSRSEQRTRRHLWLLSGGPGTSTSGIERALNVQLPDTTIYIMDNRGLGHSHKLCHHSKGRECQKNPAKCYEALDFDPKVISIHETAQDYNYVSRMIVRMNGGGGRDNNEIYMYGSSYGAILAYTAFKYDPLLYSGLLLEAFMPEFRLNEKFDIRRHVVNSCFSSESCRKSLGSELTKEEAENLMEVAMREDNKNGCKEAMEFLANISGQKLNGLLNSYIRVAFYKKTGLRPAFISILHGVAHCPDLDEFTKLMRRFHNSYQSYCDDSKTETEGRVCHCSSPSNTNHFFGGHIRFSEYSYESEEKMETCMSRGYLNSANWADVCWMVSDFKEEYVPYLYEPEIPVYSLSKLERSPTRLVITTGKLDTQTPHDAAEQEFNRLPLNEKYLFAADHGGHGTIDSWEVPGMKLELMLSFLMTGSPTDLATIREAIKQHNDQPERIWRKWDRQVFGMGEVLKDKSRNYDWKKFVKVTGVAVLIPLFTLLIQTIYEDEEK